MKKFVVFLLHLIHHLLQKQIVTIKKLSIVFEPLRPPSTSSSLAGKLGPNLYFEQKTATLSVIARALMCEAAVNQKWPHSLSLLDGELQRRAPTANHHSAASLVIEESPLQRSDLPSWPSGILVGRLLYHIVKAWEEQSSSFHFLHVWSSKFLFFLFLTSDFRICRNDLWFDPNLLTCILTLVSPLVQWCSLYICKQHTSNLITCKNITKILIRFFKMHKRNETITFEAIWCVYYTTYTNVLLSTCTLIDWFTCTQITVQ